jgi:tRNA(Arg) A34 adenosine deaminase TadA
MRQLMRDLRERWLEEDEVEAKKTTDCSRRGVAARVVRITGCDVVEEVAGPFFNGSISDGTPCTGLDPCGCAHAELRAALATVQLPHADGDLVMLCTYSPCPKCAAAIVLTHRVEGVVFLRRTIGPAVCGAYLLEHAGLWSMKV